MPRYLIWNGMAVGRFENPGCLYYLVGIICHPPGWDRVNWSTKIWGCHEWSWLCIIPFSSWFQGKNEIKQNRHRKRKAITISKGCFNNKIRASAFSQRLALQIMIATSYHLFCTIYKHIRLSKLKLFYLRLIGLLAFLEVRRDHVSLVRTLHKSLALLLSQWKNCNRAQSIAT